MAQERGESVDEECRRASRQAEVQAALGDTGLGRLGKLTRLMAGEAKCPAVHTQIGTFGVGSVDVFLRWLVFSR